MQNETSGVSPLRADVRLVPTHAPNYRRCFMGKVRLYMRQYCQGVHEKKKSLEIIEKENTEIRFLKNTARNCVIRNTMTNSTSKQQHCSGRTSIMRETRNSDRNTCQVHTNTYTCVIPQFTVHLRSCQVQAPCC